MLERDERDLVRERERQLDDQQRPRQSRQSLSPLAQMDRLFDEVFKKPFFSLMSQREGEPDQPYLPVDIFEDNEFVIVKAELPGIRRENIDLQLTPDSITISGHKTSEEKLEQKDYFRLERCYGSFSRRLQLPAETQTDKARASYRDGVLEVRIPKSLVGSQRARRLTVE